MEAIVLQAMAKWPNVPAVYGWLSLDRRGNWRLQGERIASPLVTGFIGRNYARDESGCWFFQNGPQRVFVALEYTPFVYRIGDAATSLLGLQAHTGAAPRALNGAWLDETGTVLLLTELGIGLLDDRDLEALLPMLTDAAGCPLDDDVLAAALENDPGYAGLWLTAPGVRLAMQRIDSRDVPARFGFVASPVPPQG